MCTYTCIHVSHLYRHIPHIYPKSNLLPSFHNQSSRKWVSQILVSFHFRGPIFHFHFLWGERVSPQKLSPPPVSMTKSTTPQLQTSPPKDFSTIFHRRFLGDVFFFGGIINGSGFSWPVLWFQMVNFWCLKKHLPTFVLGSLPNKSWWNFSLCKQWTVQRENLKVDLISGCNFFPATFQAAKNFTSFSSSADGETGDRCHPPPSGP